MISGWILAVSQNGVIEQITERGQRTIQGAFVGRPPVVARENKCQVGEAQFSYSDIHSDDALAVEYQAPSEGVGEEDQDEQSQTQAKPQIRRALCKKSAYATPSLATLASPPHGGGECAFILHARIIAKKIRSAIDKDARRGLQAHRGKIGRTQSCGHHV